MKKKSSQIYQWINCPAVCKQELKLFAPQVLTLTCANKKKHIHKLDHNLIIFLIKCIGNIINNHPKFRLNVRQKKKTVDAFKPFKKEFMILSNTSKRNANARKIIKQRGNGLILSSLIAAAIPLISTLIQKVFKKK